METIPTVSSFTRPVFTVAVLCWSAFALSAQDLQPMHGAVYHKPNKGSAAAAEVRPPSLALNLPQPVAAALNPLTTADMARVRGRAGLEAIGVHRRLPAAVVALSEEGGANRTTVSGAWEQTDAGPIWRLQVISREAFATRLHFHDFQVGAGRVWLHAADGQVAGPYSGAGLFENGDFWSDLVFGQSVTIEYQPAPGEAAGLSVPFELREISHIWRDPQTLATGGLAPPPVPGIIPQGSGPSAGVKSVSATPVRADAPAVEQEAACHLDVTCSQQWAQTARGVGMILFEQDGSTGVCSGSMLNTRGSSFVPYFLTAAHCLKTESVARTVLSFWGFQSASCNARPPELRDVPRTRGGARLLSTLGDFGDAKGDMTFLEILGDLPDGVFFQGWDPSPQPFGSQVVGIHHPRGTYKRISGGSIVPDRIFDTDAATYAMVAETNGRTERGSSGSALFSEPGVVVGALSFGLKADDVCALNPSPAGYTHFSVFFPMIRQFLDSTGSPPPPPTAPPTVLLPGQSERFSFPARADAVLYNGSDSFVVEVPTDAVRVRITLVSDDPSVDADLFARFDVDNAETTSGFEFDFVSEGPDGNEQIVLDASSTPPLRPGALFVSIRVFTPGAASRGAITAEFELTAPPPLPTQQDLTPGQPVSFSLPAVAGPRLFDSGPYRIVAPEGATQLDVQIKTATPGVDVDLHLSRDTPPFVRDGGIVSDFASISLTGEELITVTPDNGLAPGTYFATLAVWTEDARSEGEIRADVLTGPGPDAGGATVLSSGETGRFNLDAVTSPTFFDGRIFAIDVPAGATRLVVDLVTETPAADLDLFVRLGQPPAVEDLEVVANFKSEGLTGTEQIVIDANSRPPLQAGRYFVGLVVYSPGIATTGRVVATVEAGAPTVELSAVANAASFEGGVVAPGQIVSLFGSQMGPAVGVQPGLDGNGRLPTFVSGTIVLFGGVPAPLFFVRADQINAQVPYSLAGRGVIDVVVITNGVATNVQQVRVQEAAPGLFELGGDPARVIALNSDGSINSPSNPARRGDFVILYATGGGLTNGPNTEGQPAPSNPFALTRLPVTVRFGNVDQSPFFAGLAPGFAGLLQINIFVPDNAPTGGAVPLALFVGGFTGSRQPTIAIQ